MTDLLTKLVVGAQHQRLSLRFYSFYLDSSSLIVLGLSLDSDATV